MTNHAVDRRAPPSPATALSKHSLINQRDLDQLIEPLQNFVLKHPGAALASAFFVGVALAWWIKRR
jgi:hypothetical protein